MHRASVMVLPQSLQVNCRDMALAEAVAVAVMEAVAEAIAEPVAIVVAEAIAVSVTLWLPCCCDR